MKMRNLSPREVRIVEGFIRDIFHVLHFSKVREDMYQSAWLAFLSVFRTHSNAFSSTRGSGWELAYQEIQDALAMEQDQFYFRRFRQVSANQPVSDEVPIPRLALWTSGRSFLDNLFLYDYLYHKGTDVYQMACRLIGGSSISEVQAHYHWTPTYANQICDDLRTIMQEYMDI